jgi:hypothetical protein
MRRTFVVALLVLALAGCADYEARRQLVDGHQPDSLARLRDLTLAPYREWQQEPLPDCHSPKLLYARASVLHTALMIRPARDGFEASYDAAGWILDVADGAAARGCVATARELYVKVRAMYTGGGYVLHRERASVGAEHLGL